MPIAPAMLAPHLFGLLAAQSDLGQSGWWHLADKIASDFPQNLACGARRATTCSGPARVFADIWK
jgi:hypothetical protein